MTAPADASRVRRAVRAVATVLGVLLVVVCEFGILTLVYHSGDGADRRLEAWTRVRGAESVWHPGDSTRTVRRAITALDRVAGDRAQPLDATVAAWKADPTAARFTVVRRASTELGTRLRADRSAASRRAAYIHATLLALASIGWFFWFRGVVRRQRQLQSSLTENRVTRAGEQRLVALVRNSVDLVMVVEPDTRVSFASPSTQSVLGRDPADVVGRPVTELVAPNDELLLAGLLASSRNGEQELSLHAHHADGRELALEGTLTDLLDDDAVGGWVLTARDVTERLALRDELAHQAMHDSLTGLANRQLFTDRLSHALRFRSGALRPLVVLFIDVDDFKNVNDSLGHGVGDELLVQFARHLSEVVRQGDTAARLGGDEFAVLMEDSDLATAQAVAEQLVEARVRPSATGVAELTVRASVGLALAAPGESSAEETLRNADVAMYFAKDRGKGRVAVYDSALHAMALRRLQVRSELGQAIRNGELELHYQPVYELSGGRLHGFEALVRWRHPVHGLVFPDQFIEIAETSGLILPLGAWVLQEACRTAATSLAGPERSATMAVNVSARQLAEPGFRDEVLQALETSGLEPARLVLEITETALVDDRTMVVGVLEGLRALGVHMAIDDFGTGYSSLSYLADLPVEILKIDRSFVAGIGHGGESLVKAIIGLGDSLGLVTLAEGVEELEQEAWLIDAGCQVGQGFLWSRPLPLDQACDVALGRSTTRVAG